MATSFWASLTDLLLPPRTSERLVRGLEAEDLFALVSPGRGTLPYHDPAVTALVWELKYYALPRARALAGEFLADQLLAIAGEELGKPLLIPVPIHKNRRKRRGYNQTELLCESLFLQAGDFVEYVPQALIRIVDTPPQQGLERHKRLTNVSGSMGATPALVESRVCVVVDDVTTTGATLDEAKRALLAAGACRVHFLPLAQS